MAARPDLSTLTTSEIAYLSGRKVGTVKRKLLTPR